MSKQIRHSADVHNITDARTPHSDEIRGRMIKYSISMGIRLVCIVLVFFVEGWLQWVVIVGAVVLPYFAVIFANGGSDTSDIPHSQSLIDHVPVPALESGIPYVPEAADDVLQGEIVDDAADQGTMPRDTVFGDTVLSTTDLNKGHPTA